MKPNKALVGCQPVSRRESGNRSRGKCTARRAILALCLGLVLPQIGCGRKETVDTSPKIGSRVADVKSPLFDPLAIVLAPLDGKTFLDASIAAAQQRVRSGINRKSALEQLGWLFVSKARVSFDPGYYKLAEQCAVCLEHAEAASAEAMLLRGHVLQNLHQFKEAEPLARALTEQRGLPADFGLLGDVLMERGRLPEAIASYQKMADLKPDLQAMIRAGQVRWLKGDLPGAIEIVRQAAQASSPRAPESAAWVHSRLAFLLLQAGDFASARRHCATALEFQEGYSPALLVESRICLAENKPLAAVDLLRRATAINPLPEYLWVQSEALRSSGRIEEAAQVDTKLRARGASADPRTFALFLATRGLESETAVRLATAELQSRQDVFTWDAIAWSLAAQGRWNEAWESMSRALAEGTRDARLMLHAAVIAAAAGRKDEQEKYLREAKAMRHLLLPSEQTWLAKADDNHLPSQ